MLGLPWTRCRVIHRLGLGLYMDYCLGYPLARVWVIHGQGIRLSMD